MRRGLKKLAFEYRCRLSEQLEELSVSVLMNTHEDPSFDRTDGADRGAPTPVENIRSLLVLFIKFCFI